MEQDFYKSKLIDKGIEILIPDVDEIAKVNTTIYEELCLGIISEESKREFLKLIEGFARDGAQGVILCD